MMKSASGSELLQEFFSSENKITLESPSDEYNKRISSAKKSLANSSEIKHLVSDDGSVVRDYLFCHDAILTLQLMEWVRHGLGTSHSELPVLRQKAQFEFESELFKRYPHGVVVVERHNSKSSYVDSVIRRLLNTFSRRPNLVRSVTRPLGRILRDFFWSCNQQESKQARLFFDEIKSQGLLEHRNLLSLELQVYEAGLEWDKITNHPQLEYLLSGVVAQKVSELVLKAHMENQSIDVDVLGGVSWDVLENVLFEHQTFFQRKPMFGEESSLSTYLWKAWAISAFALNIKSFEDHLPDYISESWIEQLLKIDRSANIQHELIESQVQTLVATDHNLENAVRVLEYGENCFESEIKPLVEWLNELPRHLVKQIKSQKVLRGIFNQMEDIYYDQFPIAQDDPDDNKTHENTLNDSTDGVVATVEDIAPTKLTHTESHIETWSAWFSGKQKALTISYDYFRDWPAEKYNAESVLKAIEDTIDAEVIRNVMPHFIKWVDERELKPQSEIWVALLELISIDDKKSAVTIDLLLELAERSLSVDHVASEYDRVVEGIIICQESGLTSRTFSKFIDIYELIYQFTPINSKSLAEAFGNTFVSFGNQNWARLSTSQSVTFCEMHHLLLGYEFTTPYQYVESGKNTDLASIQISLGIYSLAESALSRAKKIIEKYCPNVKIIINSDKTNTSALSNMAKRADKILFCDRSAAHQAYFAIKAISKDIVYVGGKGSSSIVRAFFDEVS
ncbi:protein DpdD [Vibrio splendidus]